MTLQILDGPVIAEGESLSEPIDCSGGDLVRITMPAEWTPALLSFQISSDGTFFNDLFDAYGVEIAINVVAGTAFIIPADMARAVAFLRFRSGTRDRPVPQEQGRLFALAVDGYYEVPPAR